MKIISKNKQGPDAISSLSDELLKTNSETVNEEVVMYDECGDTLWDRVLEQDDKYFGIEQKKKDTRVCKIKDLVTNNK